MEEPQNIVFDLINQAEQFADHRIDIIIIANEPWFKGRDIASLLGYKNPLDALSKHIKTNYKTNLEELCKKYGVQDKRLLIGNQKKTIFINEAGLYFLIMKSELKLAEQFQEWVANDLLPKIRRQGEASYMQKLAESNTNIALLKKQNQEQRAVDALRIAALEESNTNFALLKKQNQEQRTVDAIEIAALKKTNIEFARQYVHYKSFVDNEKLLEQNQVFYIATTRSMALQGRFKYGGVKNSSEIKSRLATYNSGHADDDLMYFCKFHKCHKYKDIEERIGSILFQFKDKMESRKEMLHIRFEHLVAIVDFICDNYDKEIEYINHICKQILTDTIELDHNIPSPIDDFENSKHGKPVKKPAKVEKIDISNLNTEELHALIESIVNRCAIEQLKQDYDFATQKNIVDLELTWKLVGAYLDLYNRFNRKGWRQQFKDWFLEIKPKKLRIKGIELKI